MDGNIFNFIFLHLWSVLIFLIWTFHVFFSLFIARWYSTSRIRLKASNLWLCRIFLWLQILVYFRRHCLPSWKLCVVVVASEVPGWSVGNTLPAVKRIRRENKLFEPINRLRIDRQLSAFDEKSKGQNKNVLLHMIFRKGLIVLGLQMKICNCWS